MNAELEPLAAAMREAQAEVGKVIVGQAEAIEKALIVIFAGQHALVEGVPGVAKTLLVRTLGRVLDGEFSRIQFTPDLMPADITGTNIYDLQRREFTLVMGPVFTTFLLADEINRAPAKTQAALLQAMQERTVTIDRQTHELSPFFTVFATQNPVEYEGTYPLPEAQKDRFMLKIPMACPDRESEQALARRLIGDDAPESVLKRGGVRTVLKQDDLLAVRRVLQTVLIRDELLGYVVDLVRRSRTHDTVLVGAGPRATQALLLSSRVLAALRARDFVTPDDIRELAGPVIEHRIVVRPEYEIEGVTAAEVVRRILEDVPVPR